VRVLIKGGHVVDPKTNTNGIMDILVEDGIITEIGKDIEISNGDIIYAEASWYCRTGGCHCHLRDPGFEYKEDIETGHECCNGRIYFHSVYA